MHCNSPARKGRLDDVRGIHRALGGSGADDRVELVDEEDHVLGAADFVHHRLDALLKLTAVFCARDHQGQVERDDFLVAQEFGDIARDDFLRQPFGDRGLADAGLANQHRIVLGAAAENLNDALDFVGASDDRIQFILLGELGEIAAERAQGRRLDILLSAGLGGNALALFLREQSWDRVP